MQKGILHAAAATLEKLYVNFACGEANNLILSKRLIRNSGFLFENGAVIRPPRVRRERPPERDSG